MENVDSLFKDTFGINTEEGVRAGVYEQVTIAVIIKMLARDRELGEFAVEYARRRLTTDASELEPGFYNDMASEQNAMVNKICDEFLKAVGSE